MEDKFVVLCPEFEVIKVALINAGITYRLECNDDNTVDIQVRSSRWQSAYAEWIKVYQPKYIFG